MLEAFAIEMRGLELIGHQSVYRIPLLQPQLTDSGLNAWETHRQMNFTNAKFSSCRHWPQICTLQVILLFSWIDTLCSSRERGKEARP